MTAKHDADMAELAILFRKIVDRRRRQGIAFEPQELVDAVLALWHVTADLHDRLNTVEALHEPDGRG